ncbi:sigma 54-interacting transcriptional regulator [Aneurinibacillus sp. Ricciae_BoGa-3]|uniref:sigma-54 interaction domain-containing protein n=1 Tax=Aneurinibacillus sp. Ricciae_BoGa-3 TaxID=3022697 RepID=UPI002341AA66|nr:sigma 54-interacting transcriptional regulator [Aneurinibacillus sp. Ricciae_BoGa-3]WCK55939.1 sigma 54-interacting transcriptional regulator [Aneurinibacillus sp. Ricciae_BoGa-3]
MGEQRMKVVIVGAGRGGTVLLKVLSRMESIQVVGIVDIDEHAPGVELARQCGIPVATSIESFLAINFSVIIEVTGRDKIHQHLKDNKPTGVVVIPAMIASVIVKLIEEREQLISVRDRRQREIDTILDSTHDSLLQAIIHSSNDAISVVDINGNGLMINPAYTRLTGLSEQDVIGKPADVDISEGESMHLQVLRTGRPVRGVPLKVGPRKKDIMVNVAPIVVDGVLKGSVGVIHDISEIKKLTDELERARRLIRTLEAKYTFEDIIGQSEGMVHAIEQGIKAAQTPATVLLRGESGTGKELFAHAIHNESNRRYNQFVRVNCAAIPETLLESELFGYDEGAFTGARKGGKKGLFEEASGGTIFLDEIGELSMSTQAKLLRVIQEKEIVRIGGGKAISVDVRIIAATHVNLERAIQTGEFREDLYYRINVLPIVIPPLRYRTEEDIHQLVYHLLQKYNLEYGRNVADIDKKALEMLTRYKWPGNVRELENVISRSLISMRFQETIIYPRHLPELSMADSGPHTADGARWLTHLPEEGRPLNEIMEEVEAQTIHEALTRCNGNKTQAAKQLGLSIRNLYYKIEKYQL